MDEDWTIINSNHGDGPERCQGRCHQHYKLRELEHRELAEIIYSRSVWFRVIFWIILIIVFLIQFRLVRSLFENKRR